VTILVTSVVTVPAATRELTTLETLKAALQLSDADDDYLALLIAEASAAAESYCRRVFAAATLCDTFRLDAATWTLRLARRPVTAIASVIEDGTTLTAADYLLDADSGLLTRLNDDRPSCWLAPATIVATYSAGYLLPGDDGRTLPADIEGGVIDLIKHAWHGRTRDPAIRSETTPGVYEVTYWIGGAGESGDLPPEVETRLARYCDYQLA
jgi:uncharacterized phiE125 gp8 family phage protein